MKTKNSLLPVFVAALLTFATRELHDTELYNVISQIDYYARSYAKEKGFDYENLSILEGGFSEFSHKENALGLAHSLCNPISQNKDDIKVNLIACKSFLKTL